MKLRIALAATILVASAGLALAAQRFSENDLRIAMIQMDTGKPEAGQTVDALISCLKYWNPGDRRQPNEVEIGRLKDDTFTVSAVLRSRAIFHFQVAREQGFLVALLQRVEYSLVTNAAYQQLTDAESKRAVLRGACQKP
ncbi:MAG: hypothetical protein HY060_24995 [Proteobacteria bacterium]|nr:hypothetical protein [Pseudomonadota bacterium]